MGPDVLGHSHALSGAGRRGCQDMALIPPTAPLALLAATCAGYALVPGLDHCSSTMAREGGFLTEPAGLDHPGHLGRPPARNPLPGWYRRVHRRAYIACAVGGTWPGRIILGLFLAIAFAGALRALRLGGHLVDALAVAGAATVSRCRGR